VILFLGFNIAFDGIHLQRQLQMPRMFASPLWSSPMIEWSLHSPPCPDSCDVYCRLEAGREWMEVARVCNQSSTADTKLSTNLPSSARQKKTEKSLPQGLHFTLSSETTVWNSRTRRCWKHTPPLKPSLKKHTLVLQSAANLGKMWNSHAPTKYGLFVATEFRLDYKSAIKDLANEAKRPGNLVDVQFFFLVSLESKPASADIQSY
jgi:hypothetical protein